MLYNFVVIEGNIGAGKSSLATQISQQFNASLILEDFAENPFLPKFYENPEKYSFQLELSFLADRYQQLKNQVNNDLFKTFIVSDYYFSKSLIFAKTTLEKEEYKLYRRIFNMIYTTLPKPDLYVYLHRDVKNLLKNIARRGRDYEQKISAEYLSKIQQAYFDFFHQHKEYSYLIIDVNRLDFVNNASHYQKIQKTIFEKKHPKGIHRIIL